jgi:hypothetical protein
MCIQYACRDERDEMEACVAENRGIDKLIRLVNKKPKWDESHGGHVLNFQANHYYRIAIDLIDSPFLCVGNAGSSYRGVGEKLSVVLCECRFPR